MAPCLQGLSCRRLTLAVFIGTGLRISASVVADSVASHASDSASEPSLLRREEVAPHNFDLRAAVDLDPSGKVHRVTRKGSPSQHASFAEKLRQPKNPYCHRDYVLGKVNSSECESPEVHQLVLDEAECVEAAGLAGATVARQPTIGLHKFVIGAEWTDVRPRGCFYFPCHEDPNQACFWFNADSDEPSNPQGKPVCSRNRYYNVSAPGICPEGYGIILDEMLCQEVGICLGECDANEFRVSNVNMTKYDEFPVGCFISEEDGCVHFNPPLAQLPANPKGASLCQVSEKLTFPSPDGTLEH